jgi:carboxylesterase type B
MMGQNFNLILGFLNTNVSPDRKARMANYGLMDQIAALKWIQENIEPFGGDPNSVTLFGHNTGAACIHFLMQSPVVVPGKLFKFLIGQFRSWHYKQFTVNMELFYREILHCVRT